MDGSRFKNGLGFGFALGVAYSMLIRSYVLGPSTSNSSNNNPATGEPSENAVITANTEDAFQININNPGYSAESIESLHQSLDSRLAQSLTPEEAEGNLLRNLVTVGEFDGNETNRTFSKRNLGMKFSGSGLLVTLDGFIVTAYHCIKLYEEEWKAGKGNQPMGSMDFRYAVIDSNGRAYPIDTSFWAADPSLDIALIKADIPKEPCPTMLSVVNSDLDVGESVKVLALRNNLPHGQYGKVIATGITTDVNGLDNKLYDAMVTNTCAVKGFSGGVFASPKGQFAGILVYSDGSAADGVGGYVGGTKASNVLKFVKRATMQLNRELASK